MTMTVQSIGDQARAFAMQAASSRIKTTMATLTAELSSGEVADLGSRLQGNTQALAGIESRLSMLAQFGRNGVPLYVVYDRRGEPAVLPELLTEGIVLTALDKLKEASK